MISKNCKYSYYYVNAIHEPRHNYIIVDIKETMKIIQQKKMRSIIGYKDGIGFSRTNKIFLIPNSYFCKYEPEMIKVLFDINDGLKDIIQTHLDKKVQTSDEAYIYYVAKILGQNEAR